MKVDPRFLQDAGPAIFTGNEMLVKGALETPGGVHLLTGYPGSPVAGFFDTAEAIGPLLEQHGIVAKIAANEALSVAMVNGSQMAGCRAITAFKSVGLHVASDALALGVLAGTRDGGGALIVCGDDPWSDSTQVPADSRFLAEHVRLPMLEPCCSQEVKDYISIGFELGAAGGIYIGLMMTTAMADGGGTVVCRPNHFPKLNHKQKRSLSYARDIEPNLDETVLLPPRTWTRELGLDDQHRRVVEAARKLKVNRIVNAPGKDERAAVGFIASGVAYAYLEHALSEMRLAGRLPILKLGLSYPLDAELVTDFAKRCEQVVVVEERRSFVERQVHEILAPLRQDGKLDTKVYGKKLPGDLQGIPSTRGLNPSLLAQRLIPLLRDHPTLPIELTNGNLSALSERMQAAEVPALHVPTRTPGFCPGCPHRDSSSVLLELRDDLLDPEYMLGKHKRGPVDLVCHGDTGCYTMLMFEPNKPLMHNYSGMGLGGATGAGVDPFIDNKQLVFMGDGTFYHSGQVAIGQSIYNGQDITYIILDNKTTAMTGHQHHQSNELDLTGNEMNPLDIERIVKGMVPKDLKRDVQIVRINPADRTRYRRLMERTVLGDGVKIVIADKECGITFQRRVKRERVAELKQRGFVPKSTHMNVATEVCEFCLECTTQTGCPGLKIEDTDYGPKIQTDMSWCVNDGACQRINACPSFEEVTIHRKQSPRMGDEHVDLGDLPDPPRPVHADQDTWRCYLAGVGGMGIGLCTAILTRAGHAMGYHVQFLDKKGLAIRNGGVFSQLVYSRTGSQIEGRKSQEGGNGSSAGPATLDLRPGTTPVIPYGKADLLLGVDILEAARSMDPRLPYRVASPGYTAAVVNTAKTPTILSLMGRQDFDVDALQRAIAGQTHPERYAAFNVGDLCERVLDTKLYANIMMLGIALQRGFLPLKLEVIESAIREVTGRQADRNLRAFHIGRKIVVRPNLFVVEKLHEHETARQCLRRKLNVLEAWYGSEWVGRVIDRDKGPRTARQFRVLMKQTFRATRGLRVDDQLMRDVIIRAYDCVIWGGMDYAQRYCDRLVEVFHKDHPVKGYAVTRAVVWNLAKVMLVKDEPYVAAMLTSPEKYKKDRRRWNVNPAHGDKIKYRHHNRPEFELLGRTVRFTWKSTDWQLRLMSSMTPLRKLPGWHKRELEFRDWFEGVVDKLDWDGSDRDYQRWLAILSTPRGVTGFREVRYPKQDAAKREAQRLLAMDPSEYQPPAVPRPEADAAEDDDTPRVSLPVMTG
jgi:indolepyruvate ferredoxin oxidoreductase